MTFSRLDDHNEVTVPNDDIRFISVSLAALIALKHHVIIKAPCHVMLFWSLVR